MFARFSTIALFALCASASVIPRDEPVNQCNTGTLQCCNSVQSATPQVTNLLSGLLGLVLGPITGQIGLTCSPISVIGVGGNSCTAQPACCTGNSFNGGLVTLGCNPINLGL